jgi:dinuclear metal center YbgI/SA1388 family protein
MTVRDIIEALEKEVPAIYQESYDNCGLQVGNPDDKVQDALLTLDVTEDIINEAISKKCNLIIAHHPLLFSGLKRIADKTATERIVRSAIKNDISIIAIHTNLDNSFTGVNQKIAEKLGLENCKILQPMKHVLSKLVTYVPEADVEKVRGAIFGAGGGALGEYTECSFSTAGNGTFRASATANPTIGTARGEREAVAEQRLEVLVEKHLERKVLKALLHAHPYEEVAYEMIPIANWHPRRGAGLIGTLPTPVDETVFLKHIKKSFKTDCIRHTALKNEPVKKVAVCGGSGSFLLNDAMNAGADFFITADFKYHQFFDAAGKIVIADIGHYESEQFTPEILQSILIKKFPNFAALLSNFNTNPVKYFI